MSISFEGRCLVYKYAFFIILKLVLLDQITKWWFLGALPQYPYHTMRVGEYLNFVYVWNYGISFGFFSNYYQYSNWAFCAISIAIIIYLLYLLSAPESKKMLVGLCFVTGGGIGNLVDRIYRGAVFDFIDIHYGSIHFPAFNLADMFVSVGVCILLLHYFLLSRKVANIIKKGYKESKETK